MELITVDGANRTCGITARDWWMVAQTWDGVVRRNITTSDRREYRGRPTDTFSKSQ